MHYAWAIAGAWTQQWSEMATTFKDPLFYIRDIPQIAVLAWIITQGNDAVVATYVVVGVVLLTTSNRSLFQMGWSLSGELFGGTLQHVVLSRTPMALVLFGKAAAAASSAFFSGLIALLVAWWMARDLIQVADPALLAVSSASRSSRSSRRASSGRRCSCLSAPGPGSSTRSSRSPWSSAASSSRSTCSRRPARPSRASCRRPGRPRRSTTRSATDRPRRGASSRISAWRWRSPSLYFAVTWALFRFVERRIRVSATLDLG